MSQDSQRDRDEEELENEREPGVLAGHVRSSQGLQCLAALDKLMVSQKVKLLNLIPGHSETDEFRIRNAQGQLLFHAFEESDWINRFCCRKGRSFDMVVENEAGVEVMHIYRPFRCDRFFFIPACLSCIEVEVPPGNLLGYVQKTISICNTKFEIRDENDEALLYIVTPNCWDLFDGKIRIYNKNGAQVGIVSKKWTGWLRELFTDADYFKVTFPQRLDVRAKTLIFASVFLINILLYESK